MRRLNSIDTDWKSFCKYFFYEQDYAKDPSVDIFWPSKKHNNEKPDTV